MECSLSMLSIVIPAYNEEAGIAETIDRILRIRENVISGTLGITDVEVIVVNDASKDRTAEIVARYPDVVLITHKENRGYGGALKTGFESAKGEFIGFLDADGTYPPGASNVTIVLDEAL